METDLGQFISELNQKSLSLSKFKIKLVFKQLLEAVHMMHSKLVMHCDLKPQNILISKDLTQLKVTDLGYAKRVDPFDSRKMDPFLGRTRGLTLRHLPLPGARIDFAQ